MSQTFARLGLLHLGKDLNSLSNGVHSVDKVMTQTEQIALWQNDLDLIVCMNSSLNFVSVLQSRGLNVYHIQICGSDKLREGCAVIARRRPFGRLVYVNLLKAVKENLTPLSNFYAYLVAEKSTLCMLSLNYEIGSEKVVFYTFDMSSITSYMAEAIGIIYECIRKDSRTCAKILILRDSRIFNSDIFDKALGPIEVNGKVTERNVYRNSNDKCGSLGAWLIATWGVRARFFDDTGDFELKHAASKANYVEFFY